MTLDELKKVDLCIIIPCYNNLSGLLASIKSIHYKTGNFLILVVDDGSVPAINIKEVKNELVVFNNIEIITNKTNAGITNALNNGLEYIYNYLNVKYIARLDCGDICSPERFNKQVQFLENNEAIHLVGSWCYFKDLNSGQGYKYITPTRHKAIKRCMNFRNVFIHPTVMWRVNGYDRIKYPEQFPYAEDYGLFYYMISKGKSAIIDEFLVTCEINTAGLSIHFRAAQLKSRLKVISIYNTNQLFYFLGCLKLKMLIFIPYQYILNIKKTIFKF